MSHETARQRYARQKRNPLRRAQIAPVHTVEPVRCADCGHAYLLHTALRCFVDDCGCERYAETP